MNQRGTILKVKLDPVQGREQAGTRPALVVSATFFNERSDVLVVAPITSKKTDRVFPFEALLDHERCGLEQPSKVMLNQVRTIDKARIVGVYGVADEGALRAVNAALEITLGLIDI